MPCGAETDAEDAVQQAEQRQLLDHKHGLVMQMGELRATTADGITARARCLALHNADGAHSMDVPDDTTGRLLRWLMRDAAALGRSAAGELNGGIARRGVAGGVRGVRRAGAGATSTWAAMRRTGWLGGEGGRGRVGDRLNALSDAQEPLGGPHVRAAGRHQRRGRSPGRVASRCGTRSCSTKRGRKTRVTG